jgi:hypothetical protein
VLVIDVNKLWNDAKATVDSLGGDVQQQYHNLLLQAERELLAKAIAPLYKGITNVNMLKVDTKKKKRADSMKKDWMSYVDHFESSAKGKWSEKAKKSIRSQAAQLDRF